MKVSVKQDAFKIKDYFMSLAFEFRKQIFYPQWHAMAETVFYSKTNVQL